MNMDLIGIPIITVLCYIFGELMKLLLLNNKDKKKVIPLILSLIGGALGILIYFTEPSMIQVSNVYDAMLIGILSGLGATGTNQIIKQLFIKEVKENNEE